MTVDAVERRPIKLEVTPEAAARAAAEARGRALTLHYRELQPGGCCAAGAMVRLVWRSLADASADLDLVPAGDAGGVPLFCHHVVARFAAEHLVRIVLRRFGPWRWLAIQADRDPAMWSFFGDGPFGGRDSGCAPER